jgi:methionyl-tRNA formyltransferase
MNNKIRDNNIFKKSPTILFFGRNECNATKKALNFLKDYSCNITVVTSSSRGEKLPEFINSWKGDFIFSFRSLYILPKFLLDNASIAAVNFHPAPVEYPGSGCINFALYDEAKEYGVTAHMMNEKIDNGLILECRRFPILPKDTVITLLDRTHLELLNLFIDLAPKLIKGGENYLNEMISKSCHESWTGLAKKIEDLDNLLDIPLDISKADLERIVRAVYTVSFPPFIKLHGYQIVLKSPSKN